MRKVSAVNWHEKNAIRFFEFWSGEFDLKNNLSMIISIGKPIVYSIQVYHFNLIFILWIETKKNLRELTSS